MVAHESLSLFLPHAQAPLGSVQGSGKPSIYSVVFDPVAPDGSNAYMEAPWPQSPLKESRRRSPPGVILILRCRFYLYRLEVGRVAQTCVFCVSAEQASTKRIRTFHLPTQACQKRMSAAPRKVSRNPRTSSFADSRGPIAIVPGSQTTSHIASASTWAPTWPDEDFPPILRGSPHSRNLPSLPAGPSHKPPRASILESWKARGKRRIR